VIMSRFGIVAFLVAATAAGILTLGASSMAAARNFHASTCVPPSGFTTYTTCPLIGDDSFTIASTTRVWIGFYAGSAWTIGACVRSWAGGAIQCEAKSSDGSFVPGTIGTALLVSARFAHAGSNDYAWVYMSPSVSPYGYVMLK